MSRGALHWVMSRSVPIVPAQVDDPLSIFPRLITKLFSLWVDATYPFESLGSNLSIHHTTLLNRRMAPAIRLGNSLMIRKDAWINTFDISDGEGQPKIIIDDNCLIGARDVISAKNLIHIEHDVIIGTSVLIQDHNHAYEDISRPIRAQGLTAGGKIRIEQGCWIGHGAAIVCNQDELVIGRNSVIAANALVTKSFPPYSVIVGNPARLVRQFDPEKGTWVGATSRQLVAEHR
jgi:acetyltransferase-like isoleucine patch superfamily enzyme